MNRLSNVFSPLLLLLGCAGFSAPLPAADPVFEDQIQPLLKTKCGKCHNEKARKGGLDLSTVSAMRRGGESGEPAVAKTLDESLMWTMIDSGDMPPEGSTPLTDDEQALIKSWIEAGAPTKSGDGQVVTQHDVLPYLYARCVACHGPRVQQGGLDMRTVESLLKGGKSGPAIVPGKPAESLLLKRVLSKDMPPPRELINAGVRPLEVNEIDLLTKWVAQGAKRFDIKPDVQTDQPDALVTDADRQFWAFQPPRKPAPPELRPADMKRARRPIDRFLLRRLRQRGLTYAGEAPRLTLIRRVAFDLTGLPPEWSDVDRFLKDESDDWYAKMVDHYLDSPHYGERWARHWLDLSGYADSEGKRSADPIRQHAWRYRDYVVRAFNADKPYDRFLIEQLAGDELHDFAASESATLEVMDSLIATGFLRMAPDGTGSDIVDTVEERFEVVADEIEVLGSSVLGLTLRCAQCHTHKYDPIPQRDYYRLVAVFQGAYDVYDWLKPTSVASQSKKKNAQRRYLTHVTGEVQSEYEERKRRHDQKIAAINAEYTAARDAKRQEFLDEQLTKLPAALRDDLKTLVNTPQPQRNEVQKYLAEKFESQLTVDDAGLQKKYAELKKKQVDVDKRVKAAAADAPSRPQIRALWDRGEPSPTWIFRRGDFANPGGLVGPGVLSVLSDGKTKFSPSPRRKGSTGRRLAFAEWLTNPDHPLTSRVLVNRIWYHHFGRGIVESLANFGKTGTSPTHPELLDWLAVSFVENGWSMKWLHRQIMLSAAYRQSSELPPAAEKSDPGNELLSRMPLKRLEAESVRDSLLIVAGRLDKRPFGEPDPVTVRADGLVTSTEGELGWRRTIYVQQRRKELPTILETFDLPQMIPNCVSRPSSTVAPQALHLLNNGMVRELAASFAQRVLNESPQNPRRQVERVFEIALSRPPSAEELDEATAALAQLTEQWRVTLADAKTTSRSAEEKALANFCHVVMNSAAFVFVD